jgi:hypothetical protein
LDDNLEAFRGQGGDCANKPIEWKDAASDCNEEHVQKNADPAYSPLRSLRASSGHCTKTRWAAGVASR